MRLQNIKRTLAAFFLRKPTAKLRVRELERTLKLPLPSVIRYCKELEEEKILTTVKMGNVVFYTADRTSENYLLEKKLFNLRQLYESGLVAYLKQELNNPPIIVFGSYAKGEDIEESDIDLYVESSSKINLETFEKRLERPIQLFRNLKKLPPHLANNIMNGITLNNEVEVFT
ncbi:nucleotidyltransferase domain-containing protein [Candidatus Woesearchaeota archaeon]|nr:nucleotidyltransferase domain-containing protein [Candidatus Woesearchaeota archaeon]